ncbi:hypothetical protein BDW74DRAFT_148051 [Aspergillus multicolor]|uniref:alpha-amylase n=1 Tax=Aspergillus multicolor TaxID=41759 RepID=UPI003CCE220D
MASLLSCWFLPWKSGSRKNWKKIEESASPARLQALPSWTAPDNSLLFQGFEWHVPADGLHWARLARALPGLKAIGVDSIWLPPGCKGMDVNGNGYDIYDLWDLGEFEQKGATRTKFGTREELQELVKAAKELGISVIWDAVLNHKAGADFPEECQAVRVDPERRNIDVSKPTTISGWTGFEFAGRGDTYSAMKYHAEHFSGVDWDDSSQTGGIFRILDQQNKNKNWAQDVSKEKGNYDYLMFADLDLSHPEVRADLLSWGSWITEQLSLDGMRLDAAKHFSTGFQRAFVEHVRRTKKDFSVIGEYWSGDIKELVGYLQDMGHAVSAFDVPLVDRFSQISRTRGADLRRIFDGTLVHVKPEHAVTIVANHDTQPGQMMDTPISPSFKPLAYALTLLRKDGLPTLFYGDLYGIRLNVKKPLTPACAGKLPVLALARKHFAYGEQEDYFDAPNCIGFTRYGNAAHPAGLVCIMSNTGAASKKMFVGATRAGQEWVDLLRPRAGSVVVDKRGYGVFSVEAVSVAVWVPASAAAEIGLGREKGVEL